MKTWIWIWWSQIKPTTHRFTTKPSSCFSPAEPMPICANFYESQAFDPPTWPHHYHPLHEPKSETNSQQRRRSSGSKQQRSFELQGIWHGKNIFYQLTDIELTKGRERELEKRERDKIELEKREREREPERRKGGTWGKR